MVGPHVAFVGVMVHEKRNSGKVTLFEFLRRELTDDLAVNGWPIVKVTIDVMAFCICGFIGGFGCVLEPVGRKPSETVNITARCGVEETSILLLEY